VRAIMYHYVREYDKKFPYFRFLDISDFRKQLDFFDNEFGFVSWKEWSEFYKCGNMPKISGKVILTFDDAMSCHYEFVFKELVSRGLWGIFYVPTKPFIEGRILDVHRIHLLCGCFQGFDLLGEASKVVTEEMISQEKIVEFRTKTYKHQNNYDGVSEFKRIMNYFINPRYKKLALDSLCAKLSFNFDPLDFYITIAQMLEMRNHNMIIGSHTHTHPVMSTLPSEQQECELKLSFDFLEKYHLNDHKTYCHPYGGFHTFNNETLRLLNKHEVAYSFNVEHRQIEIKDWENSRQHLPRFDCNLFPHGKAS
jgi:peptidoglycan/xylan/chitin deacetylase (PgdA/CDA1 family)